MKKMQTATPSGVHLWLVLWKAYAAVRAYATTDIASLGLSLTDFGILEALLHKGPLPVNDIGRKVSLTSGSVTTAIDRLQARGLVERRGTEDKRARMVHLTASGTKLIRCAFGAHGASMERLGQALTDDERRNGVAILKKLGRAAEAGGE